MLNEGRRSYLGGDAHAPRDVHAKDDQRIVVSLRCWGRGLQLEDDIVRGRLPVLGDLKVVGVATELARPLLQREAHHQSKGETSVRHSPFVGCGGLIAADSGG